MLTKIYSSGDKRGKTTQKPYTTKKEKKHNPTTKVKNPLSQNIVTSFNCFNFQPIFSRGWMESGRISTCHLRHLKNLLIDTITVILLFMKHKASFNLVDFEEENTGDLS